ncbi:DUF1404 domain-containing protein [Sulfuracidifex tepidarius]|uniref:DUF1404 domain-containing protein n=1 Tax=Sulfuracidifex tepidarius TaxID=1294262 RepID=A0A510E6G1_9CREN|nr:DUF1404 domain-containing protein [Sulfuracidifex tepidarius]BBG24816.1 hypothetical protein IC006_2150 [Sulfuracidifex tepidarius]BBG27600.1 hypothetical protein IC007_2154 [Sulfuracidifex tepidarius]
MKEVTHNNKNRTTFNLVALSLIALTMNPLTEGMETVHEWLFMASHYVLVIAGFLMAFRWLKGSLLFIVPATSLLVFWHVPLFYALAGSDLAFRLACDVSMIASGILIGISSSSMSTLTWLTLFVTWMSADTFFSIVLLLQVPAYSNVAFPFSPFTPSQEVTTAVAMWVFMSGIIAVVLGNFLRKLIF